jgi:hypothetical protein
MMQGNFVIGVIVFIILVVVNFMVVTKGSGRIAEVAARFTLDAMPGKQMAIDADLSAGLIDQDGAKLRRKELEQESTFFGAMDGASKFVKGDAIAGLIITGINIVGGIIIGVVQHKLPIGQAASTYTIMTIGDGLVSQIPALIISIAAGMVVSKAGVEGSADKALVTQLAMNPTGLGMVSAASGVIALIPGMPIIPFAAVSLGAGFMAYRRIQDAKKPKAIDPSELEAAAPAEAEEEPISASLAIDDVKIELGYGLLTLINDLDGRKLTDQIRALRKTLAGEFGFIMPPVRILDNMRLANQGYAIRIKEMEAGAGEVRLGSLMAMDPRGGQVELPGEHVREPAFGLPATWIADDLREEATFRGYTVVDPATVLTTHLTEILKENMADLLSYAEVQKLLKELPESQQQAGRRPDPRHRHGHHGAARAAIAAARAGLDPRPAADPGRHRRSRPAHRFGHPAGRAGPRPPGPPAVLGQSRRRRRPADHHPVGRLGAGLRRSPDRPRRRQATGPGALAPAGFHPRRPRRLRTRRLGRRGRRAADQPGRSSLCPLDHRTLPRPDRGDEPERDPPARPSEDGRDGLGVFANTDSSAVANRHVESSTEP